MKKKLIGITVLVILVIFSPVFYWYYYAQPTKIKVLSNVTELYSLFTPYMKSYVSSYLRPIECAPNKYYYNNSEICFFCDRLIPCFSYISVMREGGERMNPNGLHLAGKYDFKTELNFYTFGIVELLNCDCNKECICEDGIKANISFGIPTFFLPSGMNASGEIQNIAEKFGKANCQSISNGVQFKCEELTAIVLNNTVMFRWEESL